MDMKRPKFSNNDNTPESTVETDDFTDLLNEDHAAPDNKEFKLELTDLMADEVPVDEDFVGDRQESYEEDLFVTDEPFDDLELYGLSDLAEEDGHFEALSDDPSAVSENFDSESEADLLGNEAFLDEDLETDRTESFEDDLLIEDELLNDLTLDELIDADGESNHFETYSDEEDIIFERSDSESEADFLVDEISADEELAAESTEPLEDDLLLTDEPHDKLTFDELIDADGESNHFETYSDEEDIIFERSDSESEADFLADKVFADEELAAENTEPLEDDLLLTDEPHDKLTFDELIDADPEDEHLETLPDDEAIATHGSDSGVDLLGDGVSVDEELDIHNMELLEDDLLLSDEPLDGLNLRELIERGWETEESTEESGYDPVSEHYGFVEDDDLDQNVLKTDDAIVAESEVVNPSVVEPLHDKAVSGDVKKQGGSLQSSDNLSPNMHGGFPAGESHQVTGRRFPRIFIVLAVLIVSGGVAGGWYGFNSVVSGIKVLEQGQEEQRDQLNRENLSHFTEQEDAKGSQPEKTLREVEDSVKTQLTELEEKLGSKTRQDSSELLNISRAIRKLESRLVSIEKNIADFGGKDQKPQVVELTQQLKLLEQLVQEPVKKNQDMTAELTHQLDHLDNSIKQLENRVSQIRQQQNSMHDSLGSVERGIAEITGNVAAMQGNSPLKETQKEKEPNQSVSTVSEDISAAERRNGADYTVPVDTGEMKEKPSKLEEITPAKRATSNQPQWVVNLASFKNRARAEKEQKRFNEMGVKTSIYQAQIMKTTWYRVRVEGFLSAMSARKYMKSFQQQCDGIEDAWVSKRQF